MHTLRNVLAVVVLSSCGSVVSGSGTAKTETRAVGAFTHVSVADALNVELTERASDSVSVTADDNLLQWISTDVGSDTLKIFVQQGHWLDPKTTLSIEIPRAAVNDIQASGASKVHSDSGLACDKVGLHGSGASSITLDSATGNSLEVDVSGSSHVNVRSISASDGSFDLSGASEIDTCCGTLQTLTATLSGASQLKLGGVVAQTATLDASGASHLEAQVQGSASGDASGASSIIVSGNPGGRNVATSGGSTIAYP